MRRAACCFVALASAAFLSLALDGPLLADRKSDNQAEAARLLGDALQRQATGDSASAADLMQAALKKSPDYAPARWQAGYVRFKNEWLKYDEVPLELARYRALSRYERTRDEYPQTVEGQLRLAKSLDRDGLKDQARAHYTRVVELDPDHAEARAELGFVRVDDVWLSREEVAGSRRRAAAAAEAMKEWRPRLEKIRTRLEARSERTRKTAEAEVMAIQDPAAILPLEAAFAGHSEQTALLLLDALTGMSSLEASQALARQAVFAAWPTVRELAAERLKGRAWETYVPEMLAALHTPLQSRVEVYQAPGGRLMYRHAFFREGQQDRELAVFDTIYSVQDDTQATARLDTQRQAAERENAATAQNTVTLELNDRILDALRTATEQSLEPTPAAWWAWWNEYNDVFVQGEKELRLAYSQETVSLRDPSSGSGGGSSGPPQSMDCLAPGTPVWTASGFKAIEEIEVGDLVLSQDPKSGELSYKPVLRTTIRPAGKRVAISVGGETIETSGGHPFWQAGAGWTKSRDIGEETRLQSVGGAVRVEQAGDGSFGPTYNLIVADFHTYFVGQNKILSHDNTIAPATDAVLPGFVPRP